MGSLMGNSMYIAVGHTRSIRVVPRGWGPLGRVSDTPSPANPDSALPCHSRPQASRAIHPRRDASLACLGEHCLQLGFKRGGKVSRCGVMRLGGDALLEGGNVGELPEQF